MKLYANKNSLPSNVMIVLTRAKKENKDARNKKSIK